MASSGRQRVGCTGFGLPQVSSPDLSGVGGPFHRLLPVGREYCEHQRAKKETTQDRYAAAGVQMDWNSVHLLEGAQALQRGDLPACARRLSARRNSLPLKLWSLSGKCC